MDVFSILKEERATLKEIVNCEPVVFFVGPASCELSLSLTYL